MTTTPAQHVPVLLEESIEALAIRPDGTYIDATFGRGGHSRAILSQLGAGGRLYSFDRDPRAAQAASELADNPHFRFIQAPFSTLAEVAQREQLTGQVDGILFDLGVSSPQLDDAERGFSFMRDGPLDMRMNPEQGISASEWINTASMDDMVYVFKHYGEERYARRIARAIEHDRKDNPFTRTAQLAGMIARVSPVKEKHKHPATRVFQAIRIHVNQELEEAEAALQAAVGILVPGGRLAVISFHSLEDRLVKRFIRKESEGAQPPAGLPVTEEERLKDCTLKPLSRAIKPGKGEVQRNPRSRSSVLRIAERLP
ncbi:16S rRNA (cytosine(1402)-N(4))-methyltransferase [Aliidiomarina minuta]|uniref:Ribosomal RNA small subunit methyltransferase H n=1 Tax=Aliidiomarina minuta TaxID=880057 RepID=A0A432WAK4_9GAMM|nr:16S rRNA (cytosine(1402)-N(4))-methyltransferase RsmH [Aliidiomarina minuta]RUO26628.1 16S rRNA (cytosine(1402)-N(4))-methyltransferase [Aliidiomarina minuta]